MDKAYKIRKQPETEIEAVVRIKNLKPRGLKRTKEVKGGRERWRKVLGRSEWTSLFTLKGQEWWQYEPRRREKWKIYHVGIIIQSV